MNALLFLHVLAAMTAVGLLIVVTGLAQSRPRWRGSVVAAASVVVSIGLAVAFVMSAKPS